MRTKAKCHPEQPVHSGRRCQACYQRDKRRTLMLKKKYGISLNEYNQILDYQRGVCATCGRKPKTRSLAVDHNHDTGEIRGLLCWHCNSAVGWMKDNPDTAITMYNYLKDPPVRRISRHRKSNDTAQITWAEDLAKNPDPEFPVCPRQPSEKKSKLLIIEPVGSYPYKERKDTSQS